MNQYRGGKPMSNRFRFTILLNKYLDPLTMEEREKFRKLMNKCVYSKVVNGCDYDTFNTTTALALYEKIKNTTDKVERHFIKYLFDRYPCLHEFEEERKYLGLGSLYMMYVYKISKPGTKKHYWYQQCKKLADNFKNIQRDLCDRLNVGDVILTKDTFPMFNDIFAKYDIYTNDRSLKSLKKYGFKVKITTRKINGKITGVYKIFEKPQIDE